MGFFSSEHREMSLQAENTAWQISRSMRELSLRYSFTHSTNVVESLPHPRLSDKAMNNRGTKPQKPLPSHSLHSSGREAGRQEIS